MRLTITAFLALLVLFVGCHTPVKEYTPRQYHDAMTSSLKATFTVLNQLYRDGYLTLDDKKLLAPAAMNAMDALEDMDDAIDLEEWDEFTAARILFENALETLESAKRKGLAKKGDTP